MNEKKTSFLGQQGPVVFVDKATAKIKFPTLGETFFPLSILRPITALPNNIKISIEQCFYRIAKLAKSTSPRKSKPKPLTLKQLQELLSLSYPQLNKPSLEKLRTQWAKETPTLARIH